MEYFYFTDHKNDIVWPCSTVVAYPRLWLLPLTLETITFYMRCNNNIQCDIRYPCLNKLQIKIHSVIGTPLLVPLFNVSAKYT
jgi:hypothetical protein